MELHIKGSQGGAMQKGSLQITSVGANLLNTKNVRAVEDNPYKIPVAVAPRTVYTISLHTTTKPFPIKLTGLGGEDITWTKLERPLTFTTGADAKVLVLEIPYTVPKDIIEKLQLEHGDRSTGFSPHISTTTYITLPEGVKGLYYEDKDTFDEIKNGILYQRCNIPEELGVKERKIPLNLPPVAEYHSGTIYFANVGCKYDDTEGRVIVTEDDTSANPYIQICYPETFASKVDESAKNAMLLGKWVGDVELKLRCFYNHAKEKFLTAADVLTRTNKEEFTPTTDYHPATKKYVDSKVADKGGGDMLASVYDKDGDGIVDEAASVKWEGITGIPEGGVAPGDHRHPVAFAEKSIALTQNKNDWAEGGWHYVVLPDNIQEVWKKQSARSLSVVLYAEDTMPTTPPWYVRAANYGIYASRHFLIDREEQKWTPAVEEVAYTDNGKRINSLALRGLMGEPEGAASGETGFFRKNVYLTFLNVAEREGRLVLRIQISNRSGRSQKIDVGYRVIIS